MRREGTAALAVALTAVVAAPGGAMAAPKSKTTKPPTTTSAYARQLVAQTSALPKGPGRTRLLVLANRIKAQQGSSPCSAIKTVDLYRARVKKLPKSQAKKALSADATALTLNQRLLRSKRATKCGGGIAPATVSTASPSILKSDLSGVSLKVDLPELSVGTKSKGGKLWTDLGAQGTDAPQAPGEPAIPTASFTVAVPDGATVDTQASAGAGYALDGVDVLPAQPDSVDSADPTPTRPDFNKGVFADAKFVPPGAAYKTDAFPAKPADAQLDGEARGIHLATIQIPLATYEPKKKRLIVHRSVNVNVNFKGGDKFGGDGGPWDRFGMSLSSGLLNAKAIRDQWIRFPYTPKACGEEFLIVTSATTRAAADTLAASRNAAGIKTRVVQTGGGAGEIGTTNAQIQTFIRNEQKKLLCVHPSYLLLMGNEELVPTFEISGATSDLPYATIDDTDTLPDIASGRIPGKDAAQVQTAVDKIVAYEANPLPAGAATKAMVAGEFQDDDGDGQEDRTFIQFAETVSQGLEHRGVSVTRVYNDQGNTTPTRFNDGSALPASLLKPGFPWTGTGAQIKTAINNNVFLAVHRDHGWSQGWATPGFTSSDLNTLTNTALPVMLSVNCSSGAYDRDDASFATTALTKSGGGAVAVFGDTEDSPSWHNSQLALGFMDALLPSILPGEGPADKQRLGDALVWGKNRLQSVAPAPADGNTTFEHRIWHLYGDPTMRMRGGSSLLFDLKNLQIKFLYTKEKPGPPPVETNPQYKVELAGLPSELTGQVFSLLKGGEVVGQGLIHDGVAEVPALFGDGSVKPGDLKVVLDPPSDQGPQTFAVDSTKASTSLSQTCPTSAAYDSPLTVTGQLLGAPAGQDVTVTFQPPTPFTTVAAPTAPKPVTQTVKTDENGNYSASVTPNQGQTGDWVMTSSYAGDDAHTGSTTDGCTVKVGRPGGALR